MEIYEAIYKRRDIRRFKPGKVDTEALGRILEAAHQAASVGFMQPWDFLIIESPAKKQKVYDLFDQANREASEVYQGEKKSLYSKLKLEGIREAHFNIAITCDHSRGGPNVLGRHSNRDTDLYSTCLAIQNLWLAARAEDLGVGWVSIVDHELLKEILGIPKELTLVAYLCLGHALEWESEPMLAKVGWRQREALKEHVFFEDWGSKD